MYKLFSHSYTCDVKDVTGFIGIMYFMKVERIDTGDILVEDSRFSIDRYLFESRGVGACHIRSFDSIGILYPVVVYMDEDGQYHLIDGRRRLRYIKDKGEGTINAIILKPQTPVTDIINLIFCNKKDLIESSVINKVQFMCFAMDLNAPESWITQSLCIPLELRPHKDFLIECRRIMDLPHDLRVFLHEKRFSLKQIINFTLYPEDLVGEVIKWRDRLHLTASILDEIMQDLNDYLRRHDKGIKDFVQEPDVQELFESSYNPRQRTERLRQLIKLKKYPVLSATNQRIQETVDSLDLPEQVRVQWDRTLENRQVSIVIDLTEGMQLKEVIERLGREAVMKGVERILQQL